VLCDSGPQDRPYQERHGSATIAVVLQGSFQYRAGHGKEVMSAGSVLLGNSGQSFECRHEHGTGDRCLSFSYTPEFLERAEISHEFGLHRVPPLRALSSWLVQAKLAQAVPARVQMAELAHGILSGVLGLIQQPNGSRTASAADERRISSVLRFLEAHLGDDLSLARLASVARMSEFHFLRVFRQVAGVTPHQYIVRARLRESAVRLKTSRQAVLKIALDAGFRDLSNFNHAFQAEFGMSPTRFRR
jgi:AraC family transcriptional regulator